MTYKTLAAAALVLVLAACGGGTTDSADSNPSAPTAPKGYGPAQLYHPVANPQGHVLQEGDTGIVPLPSAGSVEPLQVWFDLAQGSLFGAELEDEDLASIARVQLAHAATGQVFLSVDPQQRQATADLLAGRYVLRVEPSVTHTQALPMFIRFESEPTNQSLRMVKADFGHVLGTVFTRSCIHCDLSGAHLALLLLFEAQLMRSNLSGANLWGATLVRADLRETNLSGANLQNAQLYSANLRGANLANADLRGANLANANLNWTNLQGARLGGATWPNGRVCAPNSFPGECR